MKKGSGDCEDGTLRGSDIKPLRTRAGGVGVEICWRGRCCLSATLAAAALMVLGQASCSPSLAFQGSGPGLGLSLRKPTMRADAAVTRIHSLRVQPSGGGGGGGGISQHAALQSGGRGTRSMTMVAGGAQLGDAALLDHPPREADEAFSAALGIYKGIKAREAGGVGAGAGGKRRGQEEELLRAMRLMEKAMDLDWAWLRTRIEAPGGKSSKNVTCMRPSGDANFDPESRPMDDDLLALDLEEGRICNNGHCCEVCSRLSLPLVASAAECDALIRYSDDLMPPLDDPGSGAPERHQQNLPIQLTAASGELEAHLLYIRLIERLRRAVSFEWGVPLEHVSPRQTFVSRLQGSMDPSEYSQLHSDECSSSVYHYSSVLYLTPRSNFHGGDFVFTDPPVTEGGSRVLSPVSPEQGQAVMFSSGWENYHYVDKLTGGVRYAVPAFFTTEAPTDMGGTLPAPFESGDDAGRARALYECGLMPLALVDFLNFKQRWASFFGHNAKD